MYLFYVVKIADGVIKNIDEFFAHAEKYGITDDEKKTMLEYYKSRPDSAEWEQDKNLLMLNVNK